MTTRLAELAGPFLQVCCVAELIWPVSGTLDESCAPDAWPAELLH